VQYWNSGIPEISVKKLAISWRFLREQEGNFLHTPSASGPSFFHPLDITKEVFPSPVGTALAVSYLGNT
jgi:hypothetical protein